jgi:hypothetical protein
MRELQLTNSDKPALVDAKYYDYLNQWDWNIHGWGYVQRSTQEGVVYLHREVLRRAGYVDFGVGDHINRNPFDNRKENLRPATHTQNAQNRGLRSTNTTGLIGVSQREGMLTARVESNGKTVYLARFEQLPENLPKAGKAADVGRIWFHDPDFVVLNFNRSDYPDGHPDTWPPGPYSDVIRRCQGRQVCNSALGYWYVRWDKQSKCWRSDASVNGKTTRLGTFRDSPGTHTALLQAVKVADIAAIHLGRGKINLGREHYPDGHPDTWPPGPYSDVIRRCQGRQVCNSALGYWNVNWSKRDKCWFTQVYSSGKTIRLGTFKDLPNEYTALLQAVIVADIAAIALGRDKINLGRTHYPAGLPRDWPEESIPDCPALRRLISEPTTYNLQPTTDK